MKWKTVLLIVMYAATWSPIYAQGLKIKAGTCVKLETGTTMDISAGDLFLESDATGNATLIALGMVTLGSTSNAIVQRYLPGIASAWHMISAPVNLMGITGSNWEPGTYDDFYLWHEPEPGIWVNFKNQSSGNSGDLPYFDDANDGNNFRTGKGYIVSYNTATPTKNFESSGLNTGNVNITLTKSATKSWNWNAGWNLIGNPYPSGLDWSQVTKTGIVTENYAHVYNPNKAGGEGYDQISGEIAPGQGFFVQAESNEAVLALQPAHQVHTTGQTFVKSGTDRLVLRLSKDSNYDETTIFLNETSGTGHDFYDATKLFSFNSAIPQLYTLTANGRKLAINSMSAIAESTVIPLSIKVQGSSIMSVQLTKAEGAFEGKEIILHDILNNTLHKLNEEPIYHFMVHAGDNPDRFLLKFEAVGVDDLPDQIDLNAWVSHGLLYILNPDAPRATVELYNLSGQVMLRKEIGQGLQRISLYVSKGAYLLTMRTEIAVAKRKLFIHY